MTPKKYTLIAQTPVDKTEFYELEKVRFLMKDGCGLDIGYAYQDLVFSEHGLLILQFEGKTADSLFCWFNEDCIDADRHSLFKSLTNSAMLNKSKIMYRGKFAMNQRDGEEQIDLVFKPK